MWLFNAWKSAAISSRGLSTLDLYSIPLTDMEGNRRQMNEFKGKVLLITNIGSKCGFAANHLKDFKDLKEKYGDKGLEVRKGRGRKETRFFAVMDIHTYIHLNSERRLKNPNINPKP